MEVSIIDAESGKTVASHQGLSNRAFHFTVSSPKLWSPDSPNLYNVTVTLGKEKIQSYTGFRTVSKGTVDGVVRPLLNGEFIFWFGTLDQGFWPDGIYTPPNREAMVYDIQMLKKLGFNMLRKHVRFLASFRIQRHFANDRKRSKWKRLCFTEHAMSWVLWSSKICQPFDLCRQQPPRTVLQRPFFPMMRNSKNSCANLSFS